MAVAAADLRDEIRELKRLKRLERRRIKRREERHRKETADLYPWVAPLLPFFDPPKKSGRPPRKQRAIELDTGLARTNLIQAMREVRASLIKSAARNFDVRIAEILRREAKHNPKVLVLLRKSKGDLPTIGHLRGRVADFIGFVETQLGPAPPGRESLLARNRAIDLILGNKDELASYQQAKLKK
jgi:hypothetical protein